MLNHGLKNLGRTIALITGVYSSFSSLASGECLPLEAVFNTQQYVSLNALRTEDGARLENLFLKSIPKNLVVLERFRGGSNAIKVELDNGLQGILKYQPTGEKHKDLIWINNPSAEVAAYRIAISMGLDFVPPTILVTVNGIKASLQLWMTPELARPKDVKRQRAQLAVFDFVINHLDRRNGGVNVETISHSLVAFDNAIALHPERVRQNNSRAARFPSDVHLKASELKERFETMSESDFETAMQELVEIEPGITREAFTRMQWALTRMRDI